MKDLPLHIIECTLAAAFGANTHAAPDDMIFTDGVQQCLAMPTTRAFPMISSRSAFLRPLWLACLSVLPALTVGVPASAQVTLPYVFQPNTPAKAAEVNADFNTLKEAINALQATVALQQATIAGQQTAITALQSQLSSMGNVAVLNNVVELIQVSHTDGAGNTAVYPTVRFHDVNVQVVNGTGDTVDTANGLGNLIVGYNEDAGGIVFCSDGYYNADQNTCTSHGGIWAADQRNGSHNLILGNFNAYSQSGGLVAGVGNVINNRFSSIDGGFNNVASGYSSSISGGGYNIASSSGASVSGGSSNTASGFYATVSGGKGNAASDYYSSVSGGQGNTAGSYYSSVSGGHGNTASNYYSSVSGGGDNIASGAYSSVSGGSTNTANTLDSSVSGGHGNLANFRGASVQGGFANAANGPYASVSGGYFNIASGDSSTISGGTNNQAYALHSTVCGGNGGVANVTDQVVCP